MADREELRPNGGWLTRREQRAWHGFLYFHAEIVHALGRQLACDSELSFADYSVLVCLTELGAGSLRSYQIAEELGWEASRLSHQLRRMEARGLVERRECPEDGRGLRTHITSSGRAALTAAAPGHVDEVRRMFIDRLSTGELDALVALADRILDPPSS